MKRLFREPLVHFLLLGVLIFAGYEYASGGRESRPGTIIVTRGQIESLATGFVRARQRPPTQDELNALVRDYVRAELYAREAIALGLDKDDSVIRGRLRQKFEFISDTAAAETAPTDEQLRSYLSEHPNTFRTDQEITFKQICLDPERHRADLAAITANMLTSLQKRGAAADISQLGDSRLLDQQYDEVATSEISKQFGEGFASKLAEVPEGQWAGPIDSGYGSHLVFVLRRTGGKPPVFEEVREAVRREWANAQRMETNEKLYEDLLKRYQVVVEPLGDEREATTVRNNRP